MMTRAEHITLIIKLNASQVHVIIVMDVYFLKKLYQPQTQQALMQQQIMTVKT